MAFSIPPRCHGLWGSQKKALIPVSAVMLEGLRQAGLPEQGLYLPMSPYGTKTTFALPRLKVC